MVQLPIEGSPARKDFPELSVTSDTPNQRHILGLADIAIDIAVLEAKPGIQERAVFAPLRALAVALAALGVASVEPADDQGAPYIKEVLAEVKMALEVLGGLLLETGCCEARHHTGLYYYISL